jgi:rod shape-determining protein MreC
MDLVNPEEAILPNEQVVTAGYQEGLYPPGILVGFVSQVRERPGGLTREITVRPAVDFSALQFVLVLTER